MKGPGPLIKIMKTLIALFLTSLSLYAEDVFPPAWRTSPTYVSFPTSSIVSGPVTVYQGAFSTGWRSSILMRANVWDLGRTGSCSIALPAASCLRVQVTYWCDGRLYGDPLLNGFAPVASVMVQPFAMGGWVTAYWDMGATSAGSVATIAATYPQGYVLSDLVIDWLPPLDELRAVAFSTTERE